MLNIKAFDFLLVAIPCSLCILICFVGSKPMDKMNLFDLGFIFFLSAVSYVSVSFERIVREKLCQIKKRLKGRWKATKPRRGPISTK